MNFTADKWFREQSKLIKIILLIIPFVNYIIEICVRACALMRKNSSVNIAGVILFVIPWGLFTSYLDLIWVIIFDDLFLLD